MFNLKYIKTEPTTYTLRYTRGRLKQNGAGLAFWYFAPTTSLVAIPLATTELPFIFKETTRDFQEVTVQGQVIYRIADPEKLAAMLNFTLDSQAERYVSEDPTKLQNRILNLVQVKTQASVEQLDLRQAIRAAREMVDAVKLALVKSSVLQKLGIEIVDLNILVVEPTPETARALEATVREQFLEEADQAVYRRRNASIEQERLVKENELNTDLAVETKQREIDEAKLNAERVLQEQRRDMQRIDLEADIAQEEQRKDLIELSTENERKQADVNAYEIAATMDAYSRVDAKVLEAMTMARLDPQQLLALGIRELAGGAERIGQLNLAPDLLQAISGQLSSKA
ncbi:MAG: hypothetical protein [Olavius algarvensis Gamma 3 endosymbiont]|nr:MAG: hypothetical protein [Olavius algarvensis Gamma 3 endosymbiont]